MIKAAVTLLISSSVVGGCGEKASNEAVGRMSGPGESCLKTSDCAAGTKCVDQKCVSEERAEETSARSVDEPVLEDNAGRIVGNADLTTPEGLAQAVLQALREDDYETFSSFVPTTQDIIAMAKERGASDSDVQKYVSAELNENLRNNIKKAKDGWDEVRERGQDAGIIWSDTSYSRVDYKMKQERGIKKADIVVVFTFRGVDYRFELDDCVQTGRGWLMTDNMNWVETPRSIGGVLSPTELPPTCEKYVSTMKRCFEHAPVEARRAAEDAFTQTTKAWEDAARAGGRAARALEAGCKSAWDAAKVGMGAMCPEVRWE